MKQCMMIVLIVNLLAVVGSQAAVTPVEQDPVQRLSTVFDKVLAILESEELDLTEKEVHINKIVTPVFDFTLMSYLTLGKAQWAKMSKEQKARFTELFVERLKDTYRDKLSMYSGERVAFKDPTYKGNKVQIPTELVASDNKITVLYKMHNKKEQGWCIYDLEIQGVSLIRTYRSQFTEVLNKDGIESLLEQLEKPLSEEAPAPTQES